MTNGNNVTHKHKTLELYIESGFFGRYRSVFFGIYHTDTDGKLGRYNSVSKSWQLPPKFLKRGAMAPFLRSSAPLLTKKGGNDTKKGGTIPTKNTDTKPIWLPGNSNTEKMTGITAVSLQKTQFYLTKQNLLRTLFLQPTHQRVFFREAQCTLRYSVFIPSLK